MFSRILTATDMLDACDAAVVTALEIAKRHQGKLFVLHVLEPSYLNECGPLEYVRDFKTGKETPATEEYKNLIKKELNTKCEGAFSTYGNYQIEVSYGKPYIEIRRWARKVGAELIVIGPHARRMEEEKELRGESLGNTAEEVVMFSTVPVMIVGRLIPAEKLNFKKIAVCVDFSESCDNAFDIAKGIAKEYRAGVTVFHVAMPGEPAGRTKALAEAQQRLQDRYRGDDLAIDYVVWEGTEPYREILNFARQTGIDLIVMGSRTREMSKRPYIGSAVQEVTTAAECPVIVVAHPASRLKTEKG